MRKQTPWGLAQDSTVLAEGIISYSTAGHGGIWLSKKRQEELEKGLGKINNFLADPAWWEEDCDWAIPYTYFAEDIKKYGNAHNFEQNLETAKRIYRRDGRKMRKITYDEAKLQLIKYIADSDDEYFADELANIFGETFGYTIVTIDRDKRQLKCTPKEGQ